jgi:Divergent InlB B-repeat domain
MNKLSTVVCSVVVAVAGAGVAGCMGPTGPAGGSAADPGADAGVATAASLRILDAGAPIAAWRFAPRVTGNPSATLGLTVVNWGGAASGELAVYVAGPDAAAFQIVAGTDCDRGVALTPGGACILQVRFDAAALGEHRAQVIITDGTARTALDMIGTAVASPLVVSPDLDFGTVSIGARMTAPTTVWNAGTEPLALGDVAVTGDGFDLDASACGTHLEPGAGCAVTVGFSPARVGDAKGELAVPSNVTLAAAPIRGAGGGVIRVTWPGDGAGTVTSVGGALACGATCEAAFAGTPLLVATPEPGSVFAGWMDGCSGTGACRVAPGPVPVEVTAVFKRGPTLTITGAGPAAGEIAVDGQPCTLPCTKSFAPGHVVHLEAFTPSAFAGWSGACGGADAGCDLAMNDDQVVTATFARADGEAWTAVLGDGATADRVAFGDDGGVLVGAHDGIGDAFVIAYDPDGAELWRARMPSTTDGRFVGLVADGAGGAFALDAEPGLKGEGGALVLRHVAARLANPGTTGGAGTPPADAIDWDRVFEPASAWGPALGEPLAARPGGGVIVPVADDAGTRVVAFDGGGAVAWQAQVTDPIDLAVTPDGVTRVLVADDGGNRTALRFAADGADLGAMVLPGPGGQASYTSIAAAADDAVVCGIEAQGDLSARAITGDGAAAWTTGATPAGDGAAVLADGEGGTITFATDPVGFALGRLDGAGGTVWTEAVSRPVRADGSTDQLAAGGAAAGPWGRAAVAGTWTRAEADLALGTASPTTATVRRAGFVQVYAPAF